MADRSAESGCLQSRQSNVVGAQQSQITKYGHLALPSVTAILGFTSSVTSAWLISAGPVAQNNLGSAGKWPPHVGPGL